MHNVLKNSSLTNSQQNENSNSPSWKGIPNDLEPIILDFLSPIEALTCISTSKHRIENLGPYIIKRLRHEKLTYQTIHSYDSKSTIAMRKDSKIFAWGDNFNGQLGLGHNNNKHTPQPLLDPLERSFRKGHQTLNSNAFFSSTSVDPTSRFLSGYVLQPIESDLSRTQPTTTGLKNNPNN